MSEFKELEQGLINLRDQCWNLEQKIQYLCECLGGLETALERWGEKPRDYDGSAGCCYYPLKPAPATVERFTVYRFVETPLPDAFERDKIGEVVASPFGVREMTVEYVGHSTIYHVENYIYQFFRDIMLRSGVWERKV